MITRRSLLAGLASVAGAMAASTAPCPTFGAAAATTVLTPTLQFYAAEFEWASRELLRAVAVNDFSAWAAGDMASSPNRWRLASRMVELREMNDPSPPLATLRSEFLLLWEQLSRQPDHPFRDELWSLES